MRLWFNLESHVVTLRVEHCVRKLHRLQDTLAVQRLLVQAPPPEFPDASLKGFDLGGTQNSASTRTASFPSSTIPRLQ
jgi:hypothetical protein